MGIRDDYRNYKAYKNDFDPNDPSCYGCGSDNTKWESVTVDSRKGRMTAGLLPTKVTGLHCKDCGRVDERKNKP